MITRGVKQVASVATFKLLGLAVTDEIASDYIRFRGQQRSPGSRDPGWYWRKWAWAVSSHPSPDHP